MSGKRRFTAAVGVLVCLFASACEALAAVEGAAKSAVVFTAGPEWIPLHAAADIVPGSALDFSSFRPTGKPAGKFGRIVARGDHFEFEKLPGVPQRFYGVNLCFSANYLDYNAARALAARLARIGYNAVRIHHYDGALVGKSGDPAVLDQERAAELDGLIAACTEEGLYVTTDFFVSRPIRWKDIGEDRPGLVEPGEFKELVQVHEGAFSNYVSFARSFLNHVNRYTGRRYAEEPALAWISLVNEGNLGNYGMKYMSRNACFAEKYAKWIDARKSTKPDVWAKATGRLPARLGVPDDPDAAAFEVFLTYLETRFARRVKRVVRDEIGAHQLLANLNNWYYPASRQLPRGREYDFVDDHFYVDHPKFIEKKWQLPSKCANENPLRNVTLGMQSLAARRVFGRPFTISEYNYSAPGRYRGVGGIATGAQAALQDWAGLWRFAWSHDDAGARDMSRMPLRYFDMSGDPLGLASERASICLFLRRDLEPLSRTYCAALPPAKLVVPEPVEGNLMWTSWVWVGWYTKIGTVLADDAPEGAFSAGEFPKCLRIPSPETRKILRFYTPGGPEMGDGHVSVDSKDGTFLLDTQRTAGGFAESGSHKAGALSWTLSDSAATVWASSLDGSPIESSSHILLTHLTDVQNTDICYEDESLRVLQSWGRLPHIMRTGRADVSIRCRRPLKVRALASDGSRRGEVESKFTGSSLEFTADVGREPGEATYLYEIGE